MEETTLKIPEIVYYVVGALILTNVGTIVSFFYGSLKVAWWLSKLDSRVTDAKASAVRAHKRIDLMEANE